MLDANQFFSGGDEAGFYDHPINQSLRFNDNDSAYLSWTPASAGNRKTGTFSCWVKRANIGVYTTLFDVNSATSGTVGFHCRFDSVDRIDIQVEDGTNSYGVYTSAKYRDPSAWYHVVVVLDTTQATAADRLKLYVNGEQPALTTGFGSPPAQNANTFLSDTRQHNIGVRQRNTTLFDLYADAYITEVHFIDGQALDADSFGETKSGVWIPKEYDGSYGTNGFYLPMSETTQADGFSAVTYQGNGAVQSINNVGFSPDLVWIKERNGSSDHVLFDSVRGTTKRLRSNKTNAEDTVSNSITSFDADGFTTGADASQNESASFNYVAWCWDAGTGSAASNTDGSITSSVKANTDYGFSIVSWTGTGANATVGHGLSSAPEMIITKGRSVSTNWPTYHEALGASASIRLNSTSASLGSVWNNTAPTSSVFSIDGSLDINGSSEDYIAYCFHSVTGYSKFGSYSGTGASGNSVTTGFRPAFVMIKRTDAAADWFMFDDVRDGDDAKTNWLRANYSGAEVDNSNHTVSFTDTGFDVDGTDTGVNGSGGTYIYMAFADTKDAAFYYDGSGNKNNWTPAALTGTDVVPDSPTNNFATLVSHTGEGNLQQGNLDHRHSAGGTWQSRFGAFGVTSGKWYTEVTMGNGGGSIGAIYGFRRLSDLYTKKGYAWAGLYNNSAGIQKAINNAFTSITGSNTNGNIIGLALDADNSSITVYVNNSSVYTSSYTATDEPLIPVSDVFVNTTHVNRVWNFGQDSSFAGNKTPQGNTDDNGYGDFYYAPPAGYLALCTANLPEPAFSPADDESPQDHFNTVLYTGTGSAKSVTVGFQPDLVWVKGRSFAQYHALFDSVRGASVGALVTNTNGAESTTQKITSFDADGWTDSDGTYQWTNQSGETFVNWNWKANGAGVANTDGSISSTVSANTEAGFSIVTWNGNGSTGSVGHGLTKAPEFWITKSRNYSNSWFTFYKDGSTHRYIFLNLANGSAGTTNQNSTDTLLAGLSGTSTNGSGHSYVAYCFHSVDGFSKFGSYTGNGSSDGPFVYTGFRPAFVMVKRTDTADSWGIKDTARDPYNVDDSVLKADTSDAEGSSQYWEVDMASNGFKVRNLGSTWNTSGGTYIYMAFAENPFKYSNAR